MRPLVLSLALSLLPLTAVARPAMKPAPAESIEEAPAIEHSEGSLWSYVEAVEGAVPDTDAVEASEELDAARALEAAHLADAVERSRPPRAFYESPGDVLKADPLHLSAIDPSEFDIPVVVNDDVIRWMKYFTGTGRKHYSRWLERSGRYWPMMYAELDKAGLPRDLVFLSMIESGYSTHAYSRAAAVGLWQFISPTAKEWGMRVDWWVDERRDPVLATQAATRFLGHLRKQTGHWYLAWAGYNGGPARVSRAVKRHGTTDYWTLVEKNAFPSETDNYVPKIIAAAIIGHHPERYGFTGIEKEKPMQVETVEVGHSITVDVLARCAGLSTEKLQALNPHLRRFALPPEPSNQRINLPKGTSGRFLAALDKVPPSERIAFARHKVAKGENLSRIASTYGVSVSELQRVNRIKNANRIYVGMELVVPGVPAGSAKTLTASAGTGTTRSKAKSVTHIVRKGESLSGIAGKYGVKQSDVMRWNKLSNANRIYVGQKLRLYEPASRWTSYTVRKGDTLSSIASRNKCSVSDLKGWNDLSGSRIYVGQKLKIRKS